MDTSSYEFIREVVMDVSSGRPGDADSIMADVELGAQPQELSMAGEAIRRELKIDMADSISESESYGLLRKLEVKWLPPRTAAELRARPTRAHSCCLDLVNWPPRWMAHSRCNRCNAVHTVHQAAEDSKSILAKNAVAAALIVTECEGERQRSGIVPSLPVEIIGIFLSFLVDQATANGERSLPMAVRLACKELPVEMSAAEQDLLYDLDATLIKLLHVNRFVRQITAWHAREMAWPLRPSKLVPQTPVTLEAQDFSKIHPELTAFVPRVAQWYFLDVMQKSRERLVTPTCEEHILTVDEMAVSLIKFSVIAQSQDGDKIPWHPFGRTGKIGTAEGNSSNEGALLTVHDACELLGQAFRAALPPPREANLTSRLRAWGKGQTAGEANVAVKMQLFGPEGTETTKIWTFGSEKPKIRRFTAHDEDPGDSNYPWEGIVPAPVVVQPVAPPGVAQLGMHQAV